MKLVDILARELKEWPQGARWILHDGANGCYADLGITSIDVGIDCSEFDGNPANAVFEAGWQAAVDALKAEARPTESMALHHQEVGRITRQWNGEGLPPVGAVCEYRGAHQFDAWSEVRIFAEWGHGSSKVVFFDFGDGWREERSPDKFRTVRTQDQIEEMRLSVKEMCAVALTTPVVTCDQAEIIMRRLYDAGYRKFEIVDN